MGTIKKLDKKKEEEEVVVTQEDIEKKTDELMELIKKFDGSKSDAAAHICREAIIWGGDNHFESLGILMEVLLSYRETSIEIMNEENREEMMKEEEKK